MTTTRTFFEKRIIKEIHELPEYALATIEKVILLLKQEIYGVQTTEDESTKRLLSLCGSWKGTVEEQTRDGHRMPAKQGFFENCHLIGEGQPQKNMSKKG